jgi:CheY-like chemotaxis protein
MKAGGSLPRLDANAPQLEDVPDPFDLDFTSIFTAPPPPAASAPTRRDEEEALIGERSLGREGFHVVAARKAAHRAPNRIVLVVDDDAPTAELAAHVLRAAGYQAAVASNPRDAARHMYRLGAPALLLLDVDLPEMSGLEFLERMRRHGRIKDTPVILFTVHNERSDVIRGLQAGADGYIAKPIGAAALVSAVKTVLGD